MKMGYNFSNKGTLYLIDSIEMIYNQENYIKTLSNLDKNVYSFIAKKYNVNKSTLKSDITKATNNMHDLKCRQGKENLIDKVTTKIVIWLIIDKLKN